MESTFEAEYVTKAKRLVRGQQFRAAVMLANARCQDRRQLRILTVPGRAAQEEITAIRSLAHNAFIVAVDIDPVALQNAKEAGANECVHLDLATSQGAGRWLTLPKGPYDIANIDLCCSATTKFTSIIGRARRHVATRGVVLGWFSYGRDNKDYFVGAARDGDLFSGPMEASREEGILGRVKSVIPHHGELHSILTYKGNRAPMCSFLLQRDFKNPRAVEALHVNDEDLKLVAYADHGPDIDVSALYATPPATIAAWRAVRTRERGLFSQQA